MWARRLPGGAGTVGRLQSRLTLAAADDQPGDAGRHQQVANTDQRGVPADARDGKDIAEEPETMWLLQRHVQRIKTPLERGEPRRVGVDIAGQGGRERST